MKTTEAETPKCRSVGDVAHAVESNPVARALWERCRRQGMSTPQAMQTLVVELAGMVEDQRKRLRTAGPPVVVILLDDSPDAEVDDEDLEPQPEAPAGKKEEKGDGPLPAGEGVWVANVQAGDAPGGEFCAIDAGLARRFRPLRVSADQARQCEEVAKAVGWLARFIVRAAPASHERGLALDALDQVMFNANAAIGRHG